jgi:hypothetical protein
MDGAKASVTLCSQCPPTPERLPALWTICVSANAQELENDRREAIGARALDEQHGQISREFICRMAADLPIFVLSVERMEEIA